MRGHLLTTTGRRLEAVGVADFCDIVYAYAINSSEHRGTFRSGILGYMYDFTEKSEEEATFEGFQKQSMSMLDELDAFTQQLG